MRRRTTKKNRLGIRDAEAKLVFWKKSFALMINEAKRGGTKWDKGSTKENRVGSHCCE